jgi:acyl-CoA synthetase (NDP forming)
VTHAEDSYDQSAVTRLMRPRSIAIVGISSKPGSAGHVVLGNLTVNDYRGDIHLVGRSGGTIDGRPVLATVDDLPDAIDLAVFTLPAAGVRDAAEACVRRKVGAAVIFASGFAETGARESQNDIAAIARAGGLALLGPNCLGYANYVDRLVIGFTGGAAVTRVAAGRDPALAIISQSGGLGSHLRQAFEARDLPVTYTVSSGNEAGLGLADFIFYFADDPLTRVIVVYVEEVRDTARFLAAASRARARGKPVLMMHPGRSARAQAATSSHTGALAGDHAIMRAYVGHAGIPLLESIDELIDTAELLARFPEAPTKGPGILTFSGAYCAIAHDFCAALGLEVPPLSAETAAALAPQLPAFAPPRNPLDLTTQPIWQPELVRIGCRALLDDPALGSLVVSLPPGRHPLRYLEGVIEAAAGSKKPVLLSVLGDRMPLPPEFLALARDHRMILTRSSEGCLRAVAHATAYGRHAPAPRAAAPPARFPDLPELGHGVQPEWRAKQLLAAIGIAVPAGGLARNADEAVARAGRIGYPVALKAQSAELPHKTEAGGVLLGIADAAALRAAWTNLTNNVARAKPGLALDGMLVEAMGERGLELVVGAKRDPRWGPVLLVGLGGIALEALGDVRLLPPDLPDDAIVEALHGLRAAPLLRGFRGAPPVDVAAVARYTALLGQLMRTMPEIVEIDINPLVVQERGAIALDALIVTRRDSGWRNT